MKIKLWFAFLVFLLAGGASFAQGVRFTSQVSQQGTVDTATNVVVLPSLPTISFCKSPASGNPCANKATTYTDATLSTPCSTSTQIVLDGTTSCIANPDSQNNWGVWLAPGQYAYTVTIGTQNFGPYYVTAANGTATPVFNSVLYIGGVLGFSAWGSTDIGVQANAAYASIPSPTGTVPTSAKIVLLPQATGCYLTSTSIEFTTISKYVRFEGASPPTITDTGAISGGPCIQYTHVTATHAIDIDWTPTGGGGYMPGAGVRDMVIVNSASEGSSSQCITNGGCASGATGIYMGAASHGGAHKGYFENIAVKGFGTGFDMEDAGGIGWGITINNSTFVLNTIGIRDAVNVGHENTTLTGCVIAVNTVGISTSGTPGGDMTIIGGSIDSNLTAGIDAGTGNYIFNVTDVHFENPGVTSTQYMTGSGQLYLKGGLILDDTSGGTSAQNFFSFSKGSMTGFTWFGGSGGRTYTGFFMNPSAYGKISGANGNITAWPNLNNICPPLTCSAAITASAPFANDWSFLSTTSAILLGPVTSSSVFVVRDQTTGGTALVLVDNSGANVAIASQVGAIVFVVGVPAANSGNLGLTYSSGLRLQAATGTGSPINHIIEYQQLAFLQ